MGNDPAHQPILRIDDLAVSFDNGDGPRIQAVDGANLAVYPKQTVAIVGESGCGKSVTAMSLLRLVPSPPSRVDRGRLLFESSKGPVDLLKLDKTEMRDIRGGEIAMIFQEPMTSLNPVYSIGEQILEAIRLHRGVRGRQAREIAIQALKEVGIDDAERRLKAYPHEFSGGMRQRAMIAMALACRPKLLLADEPTTALDVTIQKQILDLINELKESHDMSVVLITHDLGVVAEYADVVCVMYAGRVVEYAGTADLFKRQLHPYTRGLLACIPTLDRAQSTEEDLVTVADVVDDESQWISLPSMIGLDEAMNARPWWPWHDPPAEMCSRDVESSDYVLCEIEPGHWIGLWNTNDVANNPDRFHPRPVDLDLRRCLDKV
ncbi:MAG TPA: ABC transporter ATP-binding protein [Phycisphaerales bacterium]|nr:ABC transporter ATP-binding protein [Phycisphaerales bacterium]